MPGPGTRWALVMCDQEAILWTPDEYWSATVFPVWRKWSLERQREGDGGGKRMDAAPALTDVGKLAVLEDEKVVLLAELCELLCEVEVKVLDDVDVCLRSVHAGEVMSVRGGRPAHSTLVEGATHLYHAHIRPDALDDLEEVGLAGDVYADAEVGALALHRLEEAPRGGVVEGRDARGIRLGRYAGCHGCWWGMGSM